MHPCAQCNIIYNSHSTEATEVPINPGLDRKMWYIYTMGYYSAKKENEIFTVYLEGIMVNKMSDRERQIPYNFIYMWHIKK